MASDALQTNRLNPSASDRIQTVYRLYEGLASTLPFNPVVGLGGKLLWASDLSENTVRLLMAANIAGVASMAASADHSKMRQAMREGAVDFVVTSLEEALRIMKNEVRKRQTVAVGVGMASSSVVRQMLERGVLPDLLKPDHGVSSEPEQSLLDQGALHITKEVAAQRRFVSWSVDRDGSAWLPRLDACLKGVIPETDHARTRWLRLAPRYLGRLAQKIHGIGLTELEAQAFGVEVKRMLRELAEEGMAVPGVELTGVG